MKIKTLAVNSIIAALYIAMTALIQPIAFTNIQFRIPEIFNHLIVYNKKYFLGIIIGVFLSNLFFSPLLPYDLIFGVLHSVISLCLTIVLSRLTNNIWVKMLINSVIFTLMMFIIAIELNIAFELPVLETYLYCALGELGVMLFGMPVMYLLNKQIPFSELID
ncbi:MAG: QueT transporter family protein [Bacilli bacterium]|nr:QueT transporter family protein [Bacilli bacterium]